VAASIELAVDYWPQANRILPSVEMGNGSR